MDSVSDVQLIHQAIEGNKDAFGRIVERYQTLICSLTYGACGDLARSEDLAQETFLVAWKQLSRLEDHTRLKAWLCAIARNLCRNFHRTSKRKASNAAKALKSSEALTTHTLSPSEQVIIEEEKTLTWETLETIPEIYREPMILYYRPDHSVKAVAEALDITLETAKQRLSRGRSMLKERVAQIVETTLARSRPSKVFTATLLATLPVLSPQAAAAGIALTAAKGTTAVKTATAISFLGAIGGPIIGMLGGYLGAKASIANARSQEERKFIIRLSWMAFCESILFTAGILFFIFCTDIRASDNPRLFGLGLTAFIFVYLNILLGTIIWATLRLKKINENIRKKYGEPPAADSAANIKQINIERREYRSKWSFLGLPLIHYTRGECIDGVYKRSTSKGWIAIGDNSIGVLFSFGGCAMGGIAIGGISMGVISLGGVAFGGWVLGGCAFGGYALGGLAIGWLTYGGLAVAWHGAHGGMAVARDFAVGGLAIADQANTEAARALLKDDIARQLVKYTRWILALPFVLLLIMFLKNTKKRGSGVLDVQNKNDDQ